MNKKLLALYGLKWNPFAQDAPTDALLRTPKTESFGWRMEQHVREGGFAMITGDVGTGKSTALRIVADRLSRMPDVIVGELTHVSSGVSDFYRELGYVFNIGLEPRNRWGSFKALREKWHAHVESTYMRPLILVDEAHEVPHSVLTELRILSSMHFDSRSVLAVVLAGDGRLPQRLDSPELKPIESRIRLRMTMDRPTAEELERMLRHMMQQAGSPKLMAPSVMSALCEHALGSCRQLFQNANNLLLAALEREARQIDDKLFFDVFPPQAVRRQQPAKAARA